MKKTSKNQTGDLLKPRGLFQKIENEDLSYKKSTRNIFKKKQQTGVGIMGLAMLKLAARRLKRRDTLKEAGAFTPVSTRKSLKSKLSEIKVEDTSRLKWYHIRPGGTFKKSWETVKFVLLIYQFLYLPVRMSFFQVDPHIALYVIDKIIDLFLLVDIVLTFLTPTYHKHEMTFRLKTIVKEYLLGWFILDFIALIPFEEIFWLVYHSSPHTSDSSSHRLTLVAVAFRTLRLARLLKLLKLFKTLNFKNSDNLIFQALERAFGGTTFYLLLPMFVGILIIMHLFACLWYAIGETNTNNDSWLVLSNSLDRSSFDKYMLSYYFVVQTLTTTGYGDISSQTSRELWLRIFMMFLSVVMSGLFSGQIINFRSIKMEEEEKKALRLAKLEDLKKKYQLDNVLFHSLQESIKEGKTKKKKQPHDLSVLSLDDKTQLDYYKFRLKFKDIPIFGLNEEEEMLEFQIKLGRLMKKRTFKRRQIVYTKGETATIFYILGKGTVGIMLDDLDDIPVAFVRKGFFGEQEILESIPRKYTIKAITNCEIYTVDSIGFKNLYSSNSKFFEQFTEFARSRDLFFEKNIAIVSHFIRRKLFWRLVLKGRSKNKKQREETLEQLKLDKNKISRSRSKKKSVHEILSKKETKFFD